MQVFLLRFLFCFLVFVCFVLAAWLEGIFVPRPEIEPKPMEVKVWSPNHWTTQGITMFKFLTQSELCVLYGVR